MLHATLERPDALKRREGLKAKFEEMLFAIDARPRVVVDRECKVLWRSDRAAKLLRAPIPLLIADDRLTASTAAATTELADFIEGACGD
jgi:hypothetical protein